MPDDLPGIGSGNTRCIRRKEFVPPEPTPDDYPHLALGIEIEGYFGSQGYYDYGHSAQFKKRVELARKLTADPGNSDGGEGCWEFRTTPGDITHAFNQLHQLYPDGTNSGCGMHVHVSFKDVGAIMHLTHPDFWTYFLDSFEKWGKDTGQGNAFWNRWDGSNGFCRRNERTQKEWDTQSQRNVASGYWTKDQYESAKFNLVGGKYQQLNFGAWHPSRPTLECRMLPMFEKQADAESAIRHLLDTYAGYLAQVKPVESTVKVPRVAKSVPTSVYKLTPDTSKVTSDKTVVVSKYDINTSMPGTKMVPAVLVSKAR